MWLYICTVAGFAYVGMSDQSVCVSVCASPLKEVKCLAVAEAAGLD